jgi:hypothetical protein
MNYIVGKVCGLTDVRLITRSPAVHSAAVFALERFASHQLSDVFGRLWVVVKRPPFD